MKTDKCRICGICFKSVEELMIHIDNAHSFADDSWRNQNDFRVSKFLKNKRAQEDKKYKTKYGYGIKAKE